MGECKDHASPNGARPKQSSKGEACDLSPTGECKILNAAIGHTQAKHFQARG
jgi:hypothetical protein